MFGKLKLSTYRSFKQPIMLVASFGKCGHADYREAQIRLKEGKFWYIVTDGYEYLGIERELGSNLKSALNIIEGNIRPTSWYAK